MTKLICITCPRGCRLTVDEENGFKVTGNHCPRGEIYGKSEVQNPSRVITSTVRTDSEDSPRCPVKTSIAVPKADMLRAMALLDGVVVKTPVSAGDIVLKNILGTGADFVSCKSIR